MPVTVTNPNFFAIDPATGLPLVGGLLWSYDATTGVLVPLFANAGLTVYQTNPIILDASGSALAYADFKFKLVKVNKNKNNSLNFKMSSTDRCKR